MKITKRLIFYLFFFTIFSQNISANSLCDSDEIKTEKDKSACENITKDRPWLTSVKKISPEDIQLDESMFSTPNRLYLFESLTKENRPSLYIFLQNLKGMRNSALAGNGGPNEHPRIIFKDPTANSLITLNGGEHFLFQDLNIADTLSGGVLNEIDHRTITADSIDHLEFSGVALDAAALVQVIDNGNKNSLLWIDNSQNKLNNKVTITNTTFFLLFWTGNRLSGAGTTAALTLNNQFDTTKLFFADNTIVIHNLVDKVNYSSPIIIDARRGSIQIDPESKCNQIVDRNDSFLPFEKHAEAFSVSDLFSLTETQAIGFKNHVVWGWKKGGEAEVLVWNEWETMSGNNLSCESKMSDKFLN